MNVRITLLPYCGVTRVTKYQLGSRGISATGQPNWVCYDIAGWQVLIDWPVWAPIGVVYKFGSTVDTDTERWKWTQGQREREDIGSRPNVVPWVARLKTIGAECEHSLSGSLAVNALRCVLLTFCEYILSVLCGWVLSFVCVNWKAQVDSSMFESMWCVVK